MYHTIVPNVPRVEYQLQIKVNPYTSKLPFKRTRGVFWLFRTLNMEIDPNDPPYPALKFLGGTFGDNFAPEVRPEVPFFKH